MVIACLKLVNRELSLVPAYPNVIGFRLLIKHTSWLTIRMVGDYVLLSSKKSYSLISLTFSWHLKSGQPIRTNISCHLLLIHSPLNTNVK